MRLTILGKFMDRLTHFILPFSCHILGSFAVGSLILRSKIGLELSKDYAAFAKAKGLSSRDVLLKHALKKRYFPSYFRCRKRHGRLFEWFLNN